MNGHIMFSLKGTTPNFNKRLVKAPKLYFHDTGLMCWLLGLQDPEQLAAHSLRGAIFETYVISELAQLFLNRGEPVHLYF
ncbi:DUF4143 domain-containing protein [Nitrosomonas sp. Nm58]|uniref:DUF4143 domain-containing protein n=1 Tax=Nitrosomonas sp. Nm58 TaxID=200126 RepID=UPI001C4366FB